MNGTIPRKAAYDVVVIGGGPAGTAAATFLQRAGHDCLVLEGSRFPRYHIGESLIPHTFGTLERLGLLPKLEKSDFPVKHSVRFVRPSGEEADPFYFSETIEGPRARTWQVERSRFDQMCAANARESGVEICEGTRAGRVLFDGEQAVGVQVRTNGDAPRSIAARVVVDASGRATVLGNQLKLKERVPDLRKASLWTYCRGGYRRSGIDAGETTIFMKKNRGWFWYIPLPDDIVSVGVVDEPEILFSGIRTRMQPGAHGEDSSHVVGTTEHDGQRALEKIWVDEVDRALPLARWLENAEKVAPVRGIRELAYLNRQTVGPGWVMVGDAAGFLDPIYSSGLYLALASAELAAGCIDEGLRSGDLSARRLGAFCGPLWDGVDVIWRLIHAFYEPSFSFRRFVERFPEYRGTLIDCLVGDVVHKDMSGFLEALATMVEPPRRLKEVAVA